MKKIFYPLFLVSLFLIIACNNSKKKQEQQQDSIKKESINSPEEVRQISEVISRFVRAYLSQDKEKVNALIHPEYGIAIIHRPGASDTYTVIDSIDFKQPMPNYYPYETFQNDQVLTFEALPEYDCGKEKWSKIGFFCDTTINKQTNHLETIDKFLEEFENVKIDEKKSKLTNDLEKGSFRVILAQENNHLIFHVKLFGTAWYVTILDRAYASCDA